MNITNTDQIVNAVLNPNASEEAAVAGFRILHQNAAKFGGLGYILGRSNELLAVVAQRDAQIAALRAKVETAEQALKSADRLRRAFAAEEAAKKEREVEMRMLDAVTAMIRGSKPNTDFTARLVNDSTTVRPKAVRKVAAKASSWRRTRVAAKKPRGADTDNLVLSLLTNELKCISILFHEAQRYGFSGTENAIRFAAIRLAQANNAEQGHDRQGRIAYRRA